MIAKSYPQLGWLAPRPLSTVQNAPGMSGLAAPAAPFDQQQLSASLDAMRQTIERLVAGHELILRSIDEIATRLTADHEQMTHNTVPAATNVAAGQKQIAVGIDQAATNSAQAPRGKGKWHHGREPNRGGFVAADRAFGRADRGASATGFARERQAVLCGERGA
jgi:hypothetical protein